jgi:intracellular multiplication protein IcmL
MAKEELEIVRLRDDFYRDGFYNALSILAILLIAITLLISACVYLYLSKPAPVTFSVDNEWRVLPPVPLTQPYLSTPDLLQWTSYSLPFVLTFDFVNYARELKDYSSYFTVNGWKKFLEVLNIYANFNTVQNTKLFINAKAAGAPYILNQGLLQEKYGWWIQMPINVSYSSAEKNTIVPLVIQVLVVRVSTLNNLDGVGIDNIIVQKGEGDQARVHG